MNYQILVIPGGFSYGDYVRAGAIWGRRIITKIGNQIKDFIKESRPVIGICNGFQVLVEAELLPSIKGLSIALTVNISAKYECRWIYLKHVNDSRCLLTRYVPKDMILRVPVGHVEGRFVVGSDVELKELVNNDLVIFKYVKPDGEEANGEYPYNPNGSVLDIAGICNIDGNVIGMMPHPERAYFRWQYPDWTRYGSAEGYGDGKIIFESIIKYVESTF